MVQTNIVLAIASDEDNPITAAISTAIDTLTNTSPTPTPTPTPSPTPSSNPISTPIVNPSPTPSPSSNPVTSPVISLITSPVTEPSPSPAPTQTPSPTPIPVPAISTVFPNPATIGTLIRLTGSGFSNASRVYVGGVLIPVSLYTVSAGGTVLEFILPANVAFVADLSYPVEVRNGNQASNIVLLGIAPAIIDTPPAVNSNQALVAPLVNLDSTRPEVVLANSNFNTTINIPASVINPVINFSNLLVSFPNYHAVIYNNRIDMNTNTSAGTISVRIPASTIIEGPSNWNGVMNAPKILSNTNIKPVADSGQVALTHSVIEVGLSNTPLTFDKAVRLLIPGQAGKLAGYQVGSVFTKITNSCSADTQTAADSLPAGGECSISVGNDLVIWTKHFTKFITYTQTAQTTQPATGSPEAPICGDSKPVSAPKLISTKATGRNEVTLQWEKALDPVSYYLIVYGTKPGQPEYGNPNIGGKDSQSYVVKGLDTGKTYYFKVRAGNGCMPGEFSNELSVAVSGDQISGPAKGFKSGVLSSTKTELTFKPITAAKPERITKSSSNFLSRVFDLLTRLFRG